MGEYLARGIRTAEERGAELLVIQLDTPGGGVDLMNEIVQDMRASSVPIVVYISPRGAIAGSAGTVITLAGHASAMAPETAIGAASPVGSEGQELGETMEAKTKNILKATARSLAESRGPEAIELAEKTIDEALAVSASEALEAGLVDFIAQDLQDLLDQLDGFQVETVSGERKLNTANAQTETLDPTFIEQLLDTLTNPNIVFLLLAIGVQAILIEISSPGGWIAGTIGVVCLALAAYGLGVLPVNWFGAVFVILAFALFILDIKAPTHGALTIAGVTALIVGALVLFNSPNVPSFQRVSVPLVIGTSTATGLIFFVILVFALRAQRLPHLMGQESLVGRTGTVRDELAPDGTIMLAGERWTAELVDSDEPAPSGSSVEVVKIEGLKVFVRKNE
jgi:membrane-bound serine protease (ClpP class)